MRMEEAKAAAPERVEVDMRGEGGEDAAAFLTSFDVSRVPRAPGCYIMKDGKGKPIYVGKAKDLRARVRSYLNDTDSRYSVKFLMRRVAAIEFILTANEKEALLLENSLIKEYRPRYNVRLKDDKMYLSLRLHPGERFPRLTTVRRWKKDGARYFGPYSEATAMRETLREIQRTFPLRTCSDHVLDNRSRPCLYYQMKQCAAPCVGLISQEDYGQVVDQVLMALEGRSSDLEKELLRAIRDCADRLEFEQAAALRDRLQAVRSTFERQRAVGVPGAEERDVFGIHSEGRFTEIHVLHYRRGRLLGGRGFSFERSEMPLDELLASFLLQFYTETPGLPAEILVPVELEDADALGELFTEMRGGRVNVRFPQRGEKRALLEIAERNAKSSFAEKRLAERAREDVLDQVQQALGLPRAPRRIECFDISTLQGTQTVASMAVFEDGRPAKARYRRFAIKTVPGQDDFACMREVLLRRYTRAIEEQDLPDLVLIDGGRGQLGVAMAVLQDLGISDTPLASIAKSRAEEATRSPERFFVPGRMNPIILPQSGVVVHLLARVRDEAHRFAVTFHRKRRGGSTIGTVLTGIPGVGAKRAKALLNHFGSVARIRAATVGDIAGVPGFNPKLAEAVFSHLRVSGGETMDAPGERPE